MEYECHAFRLKPGDDLRGSIQAMADELDCKAGWILTCVGSLSQFALRFANQADTTIGKGHFEILAVSGTVSINGSHLHICLSDEKGHVIGGHLQEGSVIFTTAEIVIQLTDQFEFIREYDGSTLYKELQIRKPEAG